MLFYLTLLIRFSLSYLAYSCQSVAGLWIGSHWNHELKDLECKTNASLIEFELMKTHCNIVIIIIFFINYFYIATCKSESSWNFHSSQFSLFKH